jgi:hypothetical protein
MKWHKSHSSQSPSCETLLFWNPPYFGPEKPWITWFPAGFFHRWTQGIPSAGYCCSTKVDHHSAILEAYPALAKADQKLTRCGCGLDLAVVGMKLHGKHWGFTCVFVSMKAFWLWIFSSLKVGTGNTWQPRFFHMFHGFSRVSNGISGSWLLQLGQAATPLLAPVSATAATPAARRARPPPASWLKGGGSHAEAGGVGNDWKMLDRSKRIHPNDVAITFPNLPTLDG